MRLLGCTASAALRNMKRGAGWQMCCCRLPALGGAAAERATHGPACAFFALELVQPQHIPYSPRLTAPSSLPSSRRHKVQFYDGSRASFDMLRDAFQLLPHPGSLSQPSPLLPPVAAASGGDSAAAPQRRQGMPPPPPRAPSGPPILDGDLLPVPRDQLKVSFFSASGPPRLARTHVLARLPGAHPPPLQPCALVMPHLPFMLALLVGRLACQQGVPTNSCSVHPPPLPSVQHSFELPPCTQPFQLDRICRVLRLILEALKVPHAWGLWAGVAGMHGGCRWLAGAPSPTPRLPSLPNKYRSRTGCARGTSSDPCDRPNSAVCCAAGPCWAMGAQSHPTAAPAGCWGQVRGGVCGWGLGEDSVWRCRDVSGMSANGTPSFLFI